MVFAPLLISLLATSPTNGLQDASYVTGIINEYGDLYIKEASRRGISIGVFRRGSSFFYNGGNLVEGASSQPTANTIYEIGSVTKTFTGILLADAIRSKKLKFDDDIRKYLPGKYPNLAFGGRPIRIVNLANHTSGLPPHPISIPDGATADVIVRLEKENDSATFLKKLHAVKLDRAPGTKMRYSNTGFGLLGIILEKVYGMPYESIVKKVITAPLKMQDTVIGLTKTQQARFAPGHSSEGELRPAILMSSPGSGGLRSSVNDMIRFIKANVAANSGIFADSHTLTAGEPSGGVGSGWEISQESAGITRLYQDGGMLGYSAYVTIIPKNSFGIVLLTNQSGVLDDLQELGDDLTRLLYRG